MRHFLLRSLLWLWLVDRCSTQESPLTRALRELMESSEYHELKAKLSTEGNTSTNHPTTHICSADRLACCKLSESWMVSRQAFVTMHVSMRTHSNDAFDRGKLHDNTLTVYANETDSHLVRSIPIESYHPATGITSTSLAVQHATTPWSHDCKESVDGTLHVFGA